MERLDPRVQRTRQLIVDAFFNLSKDKNIDGISVKDITVTANINRSTFYSHFGDKQDLISYISKEILIKGQFKDIKNQDSIVEETLTLAVQAISNLRTRIFQLLGDNLNIFKTYCEPDIKEELTDALYCLLVKKHGDKPSCFIEATFLSWGIYGVADVCFVSPASCKVPISNLISNILDNKYISL